MRVALCVYLLWAVFFVTTLSTPAPAPAPTPRDSHFSAGEQTWGEEQLRQPIGLFLGGLCFPVALSLVRGVREEDWRPRPLSRTLPPRPSTRSGSVAFGRRAHSTVCEDSVCRDFPSVPPALCPGPTHRQLVTAAPPAMSILLRVCSSRQCRTPEPGARPGVGWEGHVPARGSAEVVSVHFPQGIRRHLQVLCVCSSRVWP